jgi:hypothetical protein
VQHDLRFWWMTRIWPTGHASIDLQLHFQQNLELQRRDNSSLLQRKSSSCYVLNRAWITCATYLMPLFRASPFKSCYLVPVNKLRVTNPTDEKTSNNSKRVVAALRLIETWSVCWNNDFSAFFACIRLKATVHVVPSLRSQYTVVALSSLNTVRAVVWRQRSTSCRLQGHNSRLWCCLPLIQTVRP